VKQTGAPSFEFKDYLAGFYLMGVTRLEIKLKIKGN
jgi:hypothetical protein